MLLVAPAADEGDFRNLGTPLGDMNEVLFGDAIDWLSGTTRAEETPNVAPLLLAFELR